MQPGGVRFTQLQNFFISLAGHALCFFLLVGVPSCGRFARPKKPEHKIYTFDLIDPRLLSMKKTQGGPLSMGKTAGAPVKPSAKAAPVKKEAKEEEKKPSEKEAAKKGASPKAKKAGKKGETKKVPEKGFKLPKKTIEDRIKEQLKKIEKETGESKWVEADKADKLIAQKNKVAEEGIGGLLETGDFTNINYKDAIASLIYQAWEPPSKSQADKEGLTVLARFRITKGGNITNLAVEKKSGNDLLDASALAAIKACEPMPALPDDYEGDSLEVCMTFIPIEEE
jgi:TonB family protein